MDFFYIIRFGNVSNDAVEHNLISQWLHNFFANLCRNMRAHTRDARIIGLHGTCINPIFTISDARDFLLTLWSNSPASVVPFGCIWCMPIDANTEVLYLPNMYYRITFNSKESKSHRERSTICLCWTNESIAQAMYYIIHMLLK